MTRELARRTLVRLYALTHPKQVRAFREFSDSDAPQIAYACRRRLLPYRTWLAVDHLGFHYEPLVLQWHWFGWRVWQDWRERERQQREHGGQGGAVTGSHRPGS